MLFIAQPIVGRAHEPADQVTESTRLDKWNQAPIFWHISHGSLGKWYHSTYQIKNRNRVGGLMSPPYEVVRERYRAYNGVANTAHVRASLSAGIARQTTIYQCAYETR